MHTSTLAASEEANDESLFMVKIPNKWIMDESTIDKNPGNGVFLEKKPKLDTLDIAEYVTQTTTGAVLSLPLPSLALPSWVTSSTS